MRRPVSRSAWVAAVFLAAVCLAACGSGQAAAPDSAPPTVAGVGELPGDLTPTGPSMSSPTTVTTEPPPPPSSPPASTAGRVTYTLPIGRTVAGNRVLVIGDSILASISDRYGGQLCDRLEPLGWAVEVDAESGRDVTFGEEVLDERLAAGWDAAVIMLGNNYRNDVGQFATDMEAILQRLAPRPTLLLTVTEFEKSQAEVNYVLRSLAGEHPNVRIVDWADRTRDADELLGADGLHLSEEGRAELARMIAMPLLHVDGAGECLDSDYDDDSRAPDVDLADVDDDDDGGGWTTPPAPNPDPQPTVPATGPEPTSPPEPEPTTSPATTAPPAPPATEPAPPPASAPPST